MTNADDTSRTTLTPDEIRGELARLGLSQLEAARIMGVDPRTMRRWVSGETAMPTVAVKLLTLLKPSKK